MMVGTKNVAAGIIMRISIFSSLTNNNENGRTIEATQTEMIEE